jgi:hypothetical protein
LVIERAFHIGALGRHQSNLTADYKFPKLVLLAYTVQNAYFLIIEYKPELELTDPCSRSTLKLIAVRRSEDTYECDLLIEYSGSSRLRDDRHGLFSLAWIVAPLKSERFSPVGQSALLIMLAIAVSRSV